MDSDDVDVIFENSVLHQALQETGMNDIETEPRKNYSEQGEQTTLDWRKKICQALQKIFSCLLLFRKPSNWATLLSRAFVSSSSVESLNLTYQNIAMTRLKASTLLSEDDRIFLELYIKEKDTPDVAHEAFLVRKWQCISKWKIYLFSFTMLSLGMVHALFGSESSSFLSILSSPVFPPLLQAIGICLVLVLLVFVPYCLVLSCVWSFNYIEEEMWLKMLQDVKEIDGQLTSFEKTSEEFVTLTTKCLHFVKESELVAKGFLVARPTSHMYGSHFTGDPLRWCSRLRHHLFDANSQIIKDVQETICRINKSISLASNLEVLDDTYLQHHGSYFELLRSVDGDSNAEDIPQQNTVSDEDTQCVRQLKEFANNVIPSPKLSALVLLFRLHLSYFIRGLVICFLKETLQDKRTNFYPAIVKSIIPLHESMNKFLSEIQDAHDFYRAADDAGKRNELGLTFNRGPKGPTEDLYHCVNSLDIRLHSVSDRARRLRCEIEKKVDDEQRHDSSQDYCYEKISSSDKVNYEEALRQIKLDLDLCMGCYEESLRKLDVRERRELCSPGTAEMCVKDIAPESMNQVKPIAVPLADHVIVDEVFEALIEGDEEEEEPQSIGSYRQFTQEERDQMRQHREDLKRFSNELHAVVGQRAIIQRQREEAALARAQDLSTLQQTSEQTSTCSLALAQERNTATSKPLLLDISTDVNRVSSFGGDIILQKSVILNSDVPTQSNNESNVSTPFSEATKNVGGGAGRGGGGSESHISSQDIFPNEDGQLPLVSQNAEHQRLVPRSGTAMPPSERSSPELISMSQPNSILPVMQAIEREEIPTDGNILAESNVSNSSLPLIATNQLNFVLHTSENVEGEKVSSRVDISSESTVSSPELLAPHINNQPNIIVTQNVKAKGFAMAKETLPESSQEPPIQSNTVLHGTKSDQQPGTTEAGEKIVHGSDLANSHDSVLRNSNHQPNFSCPRKTAPMDLNQASSAGRKINTFEGISDPEVILHHQRLSHSVPSPTQTHSTDSQGSAREGEKRHHSGNQPVESYSLLAVKLTSVENQSTNDEDMQELLPGARKKAEALNARRSASPLITAGSPSREDSRQSSSRRNRARPPQPFVEGWMSSVQKSKDMHWASCEKLLEGMWKNTIAKETEDPLVTETEEPENGAVSENAAKKNLDHSSFCVISGDEEDNEGEVLIFSTENIDDNDNPPAASENAVGETEPQDTSNPLNSSSSTCHSQIIHPHPANPENEDFCHVDGVCVSRHNFTADEDDVPLYKALKNIEREDSDCPMVNPNPNRRRHKAERIESKAWVNISHLAVTNKIGSHFTITREREMTNREVQLNQIPSPAPSSSFNTNLALMAAARAHSFHRSVEEHFVSDTENSMTETLIGGAVAGHPESRFGEGAVGGV